MYSETPSQNSNARNSRGQGAKRSGGSRPQGDARWKTPQTGIFMGFGSQPEVFSNTTSSQPQPRQGKDVHNKFINRQVTRAAEVGDMAILFEVISTHASEMNGINLATAFHRIAKHCTGASAAKLQTVKSNATFVSLLADIRRQISAHWVLQQQCGSQQRRGDVPGIIPVQCLSIVAWSCATLRIRDEQLFAQIGAIVEPNLGELKSFELSNLLWAYAKMHISEPKLFSAAAERILNRYDSEYTVQCLSTVAWCFATMQWRSTALFASLANELSAHPGDAKPQELSTTLWAFAKNRQPNTMLFDVFGRAALKDGKIRHFKLQELSNTAWAFATAGIKNSALFEQIERVLLTKLHEIESQSIANIMWAFAKLEVPSQTNLFPALLKMTLAKQEDFKAQELSAVIWAASQISPAAPAFFGPVTRICVQRLGQFSANAVANLAKTLSTVQTDEPGLFVVILQENLRRLPQLQGQPICNALQGAAAATTSPTYVPHADIIGDIASQLCQHIAMTINEYKQAELKQISATLCTHNVCQMSPGGQALSEALLGHKTLQLEEDQSDRSRPSSNADSNDDILWPTSNDELPFGRSHSGGSGASTADSNGAAVPEKRERAPKLDIASVLPAPAPIGNTLASLAKAPAEGKPYLNLDDFMVPKSIAQFTSAPTDISQLPQQVPVPFDFMPWKIPMPSDGACAPFAMPTHVATDSGGSPYTQEAASAMLVASLHALITASMTGTGTVGNAGQPPRATSGPMGYPASGMPWMMRG